jgi:hypothetical protein
VKVPRAVGGGHLGFWREDTVRYRGFVGYPDMNLDFYSFAGIELPSPIELNIVGPALLQDVRFRIADSHWFVGASQLVRYVETSLAHRNDMLPPEYVGGLIGAYLDRHLDQNTLTSGLGILVEYDSVNSQFSPEQGYLWSMQAQWFDDAIGSDVDYRSFNLTALNYWRLPNNFLLGLRGQYDGVSTSDDSRLPPYVPPIINLRGVPKGRYQGNSVAVAEVQLGWIPHPRWTLSVFTGVGRAAADFGDLGKASSITSKGVGFRYLIARRYGFGMGMDIARGPEDTAYYIQAGSAW